ncbi:MAG TPA: dienelactone hydrolase family protein [Chitinophagaceae bacterium]|nr:dienelactone hydrolase family protein [Chitinophagaceae bacterium]
MQRTLFSLVLSASLLLVSCSNEDASKTKSSTDSSITNNVTPNIKEEAVTYNVDGTTFNGFVTYNEAQSGKRPVVLVVPEWWGLNDYPRMRARMLAEMGYLAMAVDMYGSGKTASNPQEAQALAMPFYQDPKLASTRLYAAMNKIKEYEQADMSNAAAIGYCYGGYVVLNAAKQGADLKGVVSFHGNLTGAPVTKDLLKAKVLVCHGGADKFVPETEIAAFKKSMDSIGADYAFKVYPNATHAFTNPDATATGKKFTMPIEYNGAADSASWNDMKTFFSTLFNK